MIFLFYFLVSELYIKRKLNIRYVRKGLFSKGRNRLFVAIELFLFVILLLVVFTVEGYVPHIILSFFSLLYFIRGFEEWMKRENEKMYVHDWFASGCFIFMLIYVFISDRF